MTAGEKQLSTRKTVKKQEREAAQLLQSRGHAHARPGSGSHPLGKGDAVGKQDLGECKQTEKKSISIKQAWLAKIEEEARGEGKMPFLHLRWLKLYDYADVMAMSRDWVMVPAHWFRELLEAHEAAE
jgi:Holliday junction resolvase